MNAARLEAYEAHKARRARMHSAPPVIAPPPLPMVRVVPEKLTAVQTAAKRRHERKQARLAKRGHEREARRVQQNLHCDLILEAVAARYDVAVEDLKGRSRTRRCSHPRQIAMLLLHRVARRPLKHIVDVLGRRHHTTALEGMRAVEKRAAEDPMFASEVAKLEGELRLKLEEKQ